jgi:hypothetical protein
MGTWSDKRSAGGPGGAFSSPLAGAGVEVALEQSDCEREASEAVALLDSYSEKVRLGAPPNEFASPSVQACCWCTYRLLCPVFCQAAGPEWSGQLDGAAVEGPLAAAPSVIHAGAANPAVAAVVRGERVRVVGLRTRSNRPLGPGERTVLSRVAELASLARKRRNWA